MRTASLVCHCLLLERDDGLVLIDTGLRNTDLASPGGDSVRCGCSTRDRSAIPGRRRSRTSGVLGSPQLTCVTSC